MRSRIEESGCHQNLSPQPHAFGMLRRLDAAALLLLTVLAPAAWADVDIDAPANPLGCACSDVDPRCVSPTLRLRCARRLLAASRDDFTKVNVKYTCWEQSGFKDVCTQPFMFNVSTFAAPYSNRIPQVPLSSPDRQGSAGGVLSDIVWPLSLLPDLRTSPGSQGDRGAIAASIL